jgi:hypothetical protein
MLVLDHQGGSSSSRKCSIDDWVQTVLLRIARHSSGLAWLPGVLDTGWVSAVTYDTS